MKLHQYSTPLVGAIVTWIGMVVWWFAVDGFAALYVVLPGIYVAMKAYPDADLLNAPDWNMVFILGFSAAVYGAIGVFVATVLHRIISPFAQRSVKQG